MDFDIFAVEPDHPGVDIGAGVRVLADQHLGLRGAHLVVLLLSRNFGSFAAIRAGLEVAEGQSFAVLAADLQEPPSSCSSSAAACARAMRTS